MRPIVLLALLSQVACYDGHPDYDFSCPWEPSPILYAADGFCNPMCVANVSDCPSELQPSSGYKVCGDGFQYPLDPSDDTLDPCNSSFGTIVDLCAENSACGNVVACRRDLNSSCYPNLMAFNVACAEEESEEEGAMTSTSEPGFSFVAIFFSLVAGLAIAYTIVNQLFLPRGSPVLVKADQEAAENSDHTLEIKETNSDDHNTPPEELLHKTLKDPAFNSTGYVVETGYNVDVIGRVVFASLVLVAIMFQIALIIITISYYAHETEGAWQPIPNYIQGLVWFEITWHVASLYMIGLLYPRHLRAVFYRRTPLAEANVVEVWHRTRTEAVLKDVGGKWVQRAYVGMDLFFKYFNLFMTTFICYHSKRVPGASTFCHVTTNSAGLRSFTYQLRQFIYDENLGAFIPAVVKLPTTCQELFEKRGGLSVEEADRRLGFVGPNLIAVPPPSIVKEFSREFSRGFYVYQMFMAWTWFNFAYYHMGFILAFVFISGGLSIIWVNYNNARILATLVGQAATVTVIRGGERKAVPSTYLVPGDVLEVEPGLNTCDMVLIAGKVVLDESSLTGESMPVAKDAIENRAEKFSTHSHKKAIILAGTTTMQGDKQADPSLAMVLSTGGNSEKGVQIRDILFRETPLFKFNYQVRIVVFILGVLAIVCGISTVALLGDKNPAEAWFYAMYVVASAMPPLLPTVFVVSVGLSANRLLTKKVVCSEPPRLLMAGKVRVACFDKTGTLTKQGMDFYGVRPVVGNLLGEHCSEVEAIKDERLPRAMATCQALSKTSTGRLIGTAVDLKMFEASSYELSSEDEVDGSGAKVRRDVVTKGSEKMSIVWRFDFDRNRMTSGVVVREGQKYFAVFKGSAEAVMAICKNGEVPSNFIAVGEEYASQGCYTLGICSRECTEEEAKQLSSNGVLDRNSVERDMDCLGFLTFKNELKPDSAEAVRLLREGAVRVLMITGDHPLTAVKIATELDLLPKDKRVIRATRMRSQSQDEVEWVDQDGTVVDLPKDLNTVELVINGTVFHAIQKTSLMVDLLTHVRVFARMSPQDKVSVVNLYIGMGFITAMCGDGGNDCGALRAAHVGVALSDSEASVVSPFTGVSKSAMSVVDVLLEGRCGLASAFACYKNVILYGLIETLNQMVNAYYAITFAEWCWVMLDGIWIMCTSFSLATVKPAQKLSQRRPTGSPLDVITMTACIGMFAIHCLFLLIGMSILKAEPWYQCRMWDIENSSIGDLASIGDNYESTTIFMITGAQMLHSAAAFNFGGKHRAMWIQNWRLVFFLTAFYLLHLLVLLYPSHISCIYRVNCDNWNTLPSVLAIHEAAPIQNPWGTTLMPVSFRIKLLIIIIFNLTLACLWEYLVVGGPVGEMFRKWKPQTRHLRL